MLCTIPGHSAHSAVIKQDVQTTWLLRFCPVALRPLEANNGTRGSIYQTIFGAYVAPQHDPSTLSNLQCRHKCNE